MLIELVVLGVAGTAVGRWRNYRRTKTIRDVAEPPAVQGDFAPESEQQRLPEAEEIRKLDRGIAVSGIGMAAAAGGILVHPAIGLLVWPCALIPAVPMVGWVWGDLRRKRKLTFTTIELVGLLIALAQGHVVLSVFGCIVSYTGRRALLTTQRRTREDLGMLFGEWSEFVWVIRNGAEIEIPLAELQSGDRVVLEAGQTVPCDGRIIRGYLAVDERMLTGESILAEKGPGDPVAAVTLVVSGRAIAIVERSGNETLAARLADLIAQTDSYEQTIENDVERVADKTAVPSLIAGAFGFAVSGANGAVAGVWSNYIDTLRLSAPISMVGLIRSAARQGILIRDGRSLDLLASVDTVVFDKTGTLTEDRLRVVAVHPAVGRSEAEVLSAAAAAERKQTHPIALAIDHAARAAGLDPDDLEIGDPTYSIGLGLRVNVGGTWVMLGNRQMFSQAEIPLPDRFDCLCAEAGAVGRSVVCLAFDDCWAGAIELEAVVRPEAAAVVQALARRGFETIVLSGDDEGPTRSVAQTLGIDRWYARALPEDKADRISELQAKGHHVCFVGDGINDALVMRRAKISVSLTGASAIAVDSAQIVLGDGSLSQLDALFDMGQRYVQARQRMLAVAGVPSVIGLGGVLFAGLGPASMLGGYVVFQGISLGIATDLMRWRAGQIPLPEDKPVILSSENSHSDRTVSIL